MNKKTQKYEWIKTSTEACSRCLSKSSDGRDVRVRRWLWLKYTCECLVYLVYGALLLDRGFFPLLEAVPRA